VLEVNSSDCVTDEDEVVDVARDVYVVDDDDENDDGGNGDTEEKPLQIGMMSKFVIKQFQQQRKRTFDICFVNSIVIFVVGLNRYINFYRNNSIPIRH